jgi:hypothetical protein
MIPTLKRKRGKAEDSRKRCAATMQSGRGWNPSDQARILAGSVDMIDLENAREHALLCLHMYAVSTGEITFTGVAGDDVVDDDG